MKFISVGWRGSHLCFLRVCYATVGLDFISQLNVNRRRRVGEESLILYAAAAGFASWLFALRERGRVSPPGMQKFTLEDDARRVGV